ncbi:zinc-ribbon domain-containing protein [Streptomyces sp. NPDC048057]|uniref:zinc-ribbon domain-containing protein n=1 Tax=Streptomyces sp. NPDC048057 TaxID=3155628 RepID=UPI0033F5AD57
MIIFGTKGYLYQLAILTLVCGQCGNPAAHTLRKRVTKFTLFFVPLFPVSSKYGTQCTFCGAESQITQQQADALQAQAAGGQGVPGVQGGQGYGQSQPAPNQQGNPFQQGNNTPGNPYQR